MATKLKLKARPKLGKKDADDKEKETPKAKGSAIEKELLKATKLEPREKGEEWGDYAKRLGEAVSELPDDKYEELSEPTKDWFTKAADRLNKDQADKVPAFPDADADEEEEQEEDPKNKKGKKDDKEEKEDKKKKSAKDDDDDDGGDKEEKPSKSPSGIARVIVCENPDISLEDLRADMKKRGVKITENQAHAVHNLTKRVIKVMTALGWKPPK